MPSLRFAVVIMSGCLAVAVAACAQGSAVVDDDGAGASDGGASNGGSAGSGDEGGSTPTCDTPSDCPPSGTDCSNPTCSDGLCAVELVDAGTQCADAGGGYCDGGGNCVQCITANDCANGVCVGNVCAAPTCDDSVMNGNETDVDCGGLDCSACQNGEQCLLAADCLSGLCDDTQAPPLCIPCVDNDDCAATPGYYCEAGACTPKKVDGALCGDPAECNSGFCPNPEGVCCNALCDGGCQSCAQAATTIADGTCGPIMVCISGDGCCAGGCSAAMDSDCALIGIDIGPHNSLYTATNATRGFWFTAPVAFVIKELRVPSEAGTGAQHIHVVKFTNPPPEYSNSTIAFNTVHYSLNTPGNGFVAVNIPVAQGEHIGVLGARDGAAAGQLSMSYGISNPYNTTIFNQLVVLRRLVYQANMVTTIPGPLSTESNGGSIGRVEFNYGP